MSTKNLTVEVTRVTPKMAKEYQNQFPRPSGPVVSAILYYTNQLHPAEADAFFTQLNLGTGLREGDPVFALRRQLEQFLSSKVLRPRANQAPALIVKAWNAWLAGEQVNGTLRWMGGGTARESFPVIAGAGFFPLEAEDGEA